MNRITEFERRIGYKMFEILNETSKAYNKEKDNNIFAYYVLGLTNMAEIAIQIFTKMEKNYYDEN